MGKRKQLTVKRMLEILNTFLISTEAYAIRRTIITKNVNNKWKNLERMILIILTKAFWWYVN